MCQRWLGQSAEPAVRFQAAAGTEAVLSVTVTPDMGARFDDEDVHPVYGTAALVRHMEQVSRRLLTPHLEDGEEGVGRRVEVEQGRPVPVGEVVELTATVTAADNRRLVTRVVARHGGREVASGRFVQAVVDRDDWLAAAQRPGS